MGRQKIVIYDLDQVYRERFASYLLHYKTREMELFVFTGREHLISALEEGNYHLAVLGCGCEEVKKEIKAKGIPILVLTEEEESAQTGKNLPEDTVEAIALQDGGEIVYTSKYQSMDKITRQMQILTDTMHGTEYVFRNVSALEIIGVVSPIKHEMQMMFSILCAVYMAKNDKVLYFNLMEYSGFYSLFEQEGGYDLGDIVLRLREQKLRLDEFYKGIYEMGNISYVCPFENPENLLEFYIEDFQRLLDFIIEKTDFKTIVIDFGPQMKNFTEMLDACTLVYCIGKNGYYFECQTEQFLAYLRKRLDNVFFERLKILKLPFQAKWIRGGGNLLEQLEWSEFGDFVREIMNGGGCENPE